MCYDTVHLFLHKGVSWPFLRMSTEISLDLQYVVTMVAVTMEMTWFIGFVS